MNTLNAITIPQPYASLIAMGALNYCTIDLKMAANVVKGIIYDKIAIHSGEAISEDMQKVWGSEASAPFKAYLAKRGIEDINDLPLGKVLAIAELADVCRMSKGRARRVVDWAAHRPINILQQNYINLRSGKTLLMFTNSVMLAEPLALELTQMPTDGPEGIWLWQQGS